jgi:hypothetical protein
LDCGGLVVAIEILVVEGDFADVDEREFDRGLQLLGEELDERGAEGGLAQASGDACNADGCGLRHEEVVLPGSYGRCGTVFR